jgi:hypothetical protein
MYEKLMMDAEANQPAESAEPTEKKNPTSGNTSQPAVAADAPPSAPGRFGTIMSFIVFLVGLLVSIIMYVQAPTKINLDSWYNGCPSSGSFERSCKANSAVLRVSCALTVFYACQAIFTRIYTQYYDSLWVPKVLAFGALIIGLFFGDSSSFGLDGYAWFARITGFFFLILLQVILIDFAYSWNEKWLEYAGGPDGEKGRFWLIGIILISIAFFAGSFTVLGLLYWQFDCSDAKVIISLTLCFSVIATIIQLFFSEQGSILTSAVMTAYCTYVCYSSVTLNPDTSCNLTLDSEYQTISTIIGLTLTVISLLWTTYNTGNHNHNNNNNNNTLSAYMI